MGPSPDLVLFEFTRLLRRICEDCEIELETGMALEDIPGIDSLRLLQAVAHLEEHFRVEIDVVALDDLCRVRDVVNALTTARPVLSSE